MTRRLILIRHAKSGWDDAGLDDHDRTLNARGHRSAAAVGQWLADRGHVPQAACLSTAQRVVETWAGIAPRLQAEVPETWDRQLYLSPPQTMLAKLAEQTAEAVVMIAHNPGIGMLAQSLVQEQPKNDAFVAFPTCATLVLEFHTPDWCIAPRSGRVVDFVTARELTD